MTMSSVATREKTSDATTELTLDSWTASSARVNTTGTEYTIAQSMYANTIAEEYGRCSFAMIQPLAIQMAYESTMYAARSTVVSGDIHGRTKPLSSVTLKTYQIT